jgi:hypothetical protein
MTKKRETGQVGNIQLTPITTKERRNLDKKIRKRNRKLRERYHEIHGKVVDWVSHSIEEGSLYVSIRFKDKTDFSLRFSPQIVTDGIDLSDIKTGDYAIIREYYRRREE